jgi:uncharacterized protein involved in outer membrane biogenesis
MQIAGVSAQHVHVNLLQNSARVGTLMLQDPHLLLRLDESGFNLQQFMPANETVSAESEPADMPVLIERVTAKDGTIEFIDQTVTPQTDITIRSLAMDACDVSVLPELPPGKSKPRDSRGRVRSG